MITVRLSGGIGNQLFQYAFGRALSLRTNQTLVLDTHSTNNSIRPYGLNVFNVETKTVGGVTALSNLVFLKIKDLVKAHKTIVHEKGFSFDQSIYNSTKGGYFIGLWQSETYFKDSKEIIKKDLTYKKPLSPAGNSFAEKIKNIESVSIHIRRGDYTNKHTVDKHGLCSKEYYDQAISYIQKKYSDAYFFIFSDDIAWVKDNLDLPAHKTYVSGTNSVDHFEELHLMSLCKHNIIANSTFSWWAAWLNNNPLKVVIAPKKWFKLPIPTKDLIPNSWIQL